MLQNSNFPPRPAEISDSETCIALNGLALAFQKCSTIFKLEVVHKICTLLAVGGEDGWLCFVSVPLKKMFAHNFLAKLTKSNGGVEEGL